MPEVEHGIYHIEEIAPGAYKIYERRDASMYLVCGKEKACLIDAGFGLNDLKALVAELTALPVVLVNTHGHEDHVLGNHWFYDGGARRVFLHPADQSMYRAIVSGYAKMLADPWVKENYAEFLRGFDPSAVRFPEAEDIRDGDTIDLGGKILEVIELPGHTAGSILLLDRDAKICYSGDAVIEHAWLFLPESLPLEAYAAALRRARLILGDAGVERIYDGHYSNCPLTLAHMDTVIAGLERALAGEAEARPFQNREGSGVEYVFDELSVLARAPEKHP